MAAYWFVDRIMGNVIDSLFDYLKDRYSSQTGMEMERERLRVNYSRIKSLLSAVDNRAQITEPGSLLNQWIWQLRDAIDEADDLIDDIEYMKHEEQLETNGRSPPSWLPRKLRKVCRDGVSVFKSDPGLERLKEVVQKLDRISSEVSTTFFNLIKDTEKKEKDQLDELSKARETGSLPANNDFIGRDKDKKFIIQWLKKPSLEDFSPHKCINISLLSVEGDGGMGKTTLLQHVYEDEITKEFELKMWVCVSTNFDVKKVILDMLESHKSERISLGTIEALQRSLLSVVKSKKFLLVLDDIWLEEQDINKWEIVFAPLSHGGLGSKILITTRMHDAASMIAKAINRKNESLILKGLEEYECLKLLNTHAFAGKNPDDHKKLKSIAGDLVKKLYGCPLAAKVIGGVLNNNLDERYWTNMSKDVMGHNEISSILKLSYIYLPKELQNCFAFCSIFPQDYIFDKDDLVRMWIAEGFIQPSNNGETMEDVAGRYFDILVNKSFFDKHFERHYKMHDFLHELAQYVFVQECFRVEDDEDLNLRIPETIRHLSVKTNSLEVLKKIGKCKKLRTLCITSDIDNQDFIDVLTELFKATRSIRLLSIHADIQKMIPEAVECLNHLRYLKFCFSADTLLPRSLSNLYHLQFIIRRGSLFHYPGDFFPRDMNNLSNLRYMNFHSFKFPGIGKLKFLQELNGFSVENKTGYGIGELKHMNDLRILRIKCLENVRDANDACNAKLCDKRKLEDLSLQWDDIQPHNSDLDERVLSNLQPHENLKKLTMRNYMGVRSAKWMNNANLSTNLQVITLSECLEWEILPPFGQFPFLKFLSLFNMPKVVRFDTTSCVFESLESLTIQYLAALEDWFDARVDGLFPRLTLLSLSNCPNLQELPYLPPKLKELTIRNIGWKTLNCCNISKSIPLKTLKVCNCPNITYISLAGEIVGRLKAQIKDCPNLISLGEHQEVGITENIPTSVERLQLELVCIPLLKSLPYLPPSLCTLNIEELDDLDYLPCLSSLSSLRQLHIANVPQLQKLADLPASLCELRLQKLDNLNCLPSLSSLTKLVIVEIPQLRELPDLPASLCELRLRKLDNLNCLPSLSSLTKLAIVEVPQLRELPDLPASLCQLYLQELDSLNFLPCLSRLSCLPELSLYLLPQLRELPDLHPSLCTLKLTCLANLNCLPSSLPSLYSLTELYIFIVPQLLELPNLPPSLCFLSLSFLENLNCLPSCLPSLSCLTELKINKVPQIRELPELPTSLRELRLSYLDNLNSLPSLSSLTKLEIIGVPQLRELPALPPSLHELELRSLDNLNCLRSLPSLTKLEIIRVPQLRNLSDLPASLCKLRLQKLDNLNCLPSLSSLTELIIIKVPQLRELPDLSPSTDLRIKCCDPELMKRYEGLYSSPI